MFGPEYSKIQTLFKRNDRGVIIPGDWTTEEFTYLQNLPWQWTEKVDGTNIRLHWDGQTVAVGGRTDNAQIPTFLIAALKPFLEPSAWGAAFEGSSNVTVYGEGYGAKIQKGGQYRPDPAVVVFDVKIGEWWLRRADAADVARKLGLEMVPVVGQMPPTEAVSSVRLQAIRSAWPDARIEGLVGRPVVDLLDRKGERILAKIKHKDFADLERRGGTPLSEQ